MNRHSPLKAEAAVSQREISTGWSETHSARAAEYRQWAEHYRERLAHCLEMAAYHERIAKADLEAANG